jgi:uncharacterized membrane protein
MHAMLTFFTGLPAKLWAYAAATGALMLVVWRVLAGVRQAERDRLAAQAAMDEQQARDRGNAAAADAERDGADKLLRDGKF